MDATNDRLPAEEDFIAYETLDEYSACEAFLGKSREEAQEMFAGETGQERLFELGHMGPIAFRYYLPAAVAMIRSDAAVDRPDLLDGLNVVLLGLTYDERLVSRELAGICREACQYVLDSWNKFGAYEFDESSRPAFLDLERTFRRLAEEDARKAPEKVPWHWLQKLRGLLGR